MAKQIKTIVWGIGYTGGFDEAVNKALEEGWTLVRRDVIPMQVYRESILYAELEKSDDPIEVPSSEECEIDYCDKCRYVSVSCSSYPCSICDCGCNPPTHWEPKG